MNTAFNCKSYEEMCKLCQLFLDGGFRYAPVCLQYKDNGILGCCGLRVDLVKRIISGYQMKYDNASTWTSIKLLVDLTGKKEKQDVPLPIGNGEYACIVDKDGKFATVGCQKIEFTQIEAVLETMTKLQKPLENSQ